MMDRRAFITVVGGGILAAPLAGETQQPGKIPRIGLLRPGSPPDPFVGAFRQGLSELGYVESQSVAIDVRYARVDQLEMWLPASMDESFEVSPKKGVWSRVTGHAEYSNYRTFTTSVRIK